MHVWQAISTQRAVRRFADRALEPGELERIVRAARRAPSSKNEQRWAFVVVTERERLRALSRVGRYAGHLAGAAAAIALVTPDRADPGERESIAFDLGQCAQTMMLAAWELGIGSVHASVYDEELARRLLGYPRDRRCDTVLSLGYPADPSDLTRPARKGGRKPLEKLLHRESW